MTQNSLPGERRATITDVAREAGTGKTSISRFLNGETAALSTDLRSRIEAAIAKLDYRPNQMARGLKRGRNRLIGLLVADLTNPYSVEVLQGVEAACHAQGYMPLICHAANEADLERRYLQLLTTYRVEGIIVNALGVREDILLDFASGGIPVVLVDRTVDGLVSDMVGLDNPRAVSVGIHHLAERGIRDVVFVVQPFERVSSRRVREEAFRGVIDECGIAGTTVVMDLDDNRTTLAHVGEVVERVAADGRRAGVFAANAPVALALALYFKERFGNDWQATVAMISIDDPDWAELAGMTSVRQPTYEIGAKAVAFLHERIEGATGEARVALLAGELVVRASTR